MVNRSMLLVLFWFVIFFLHAGQPVNAQPRKIPPFRILLTNNQLYKAENLPQGKPVLVLYFSVDCDHCKQLITEMCHKMESLKKATVVMITFYTVSETTLFSKQFNLSKFPNVIVGTENNESFVRNYYQIVNTPYMALHDKDGNFMASFAKDIDLDLVVQRIDKLK